MVANVDYNSWRLPELFSKIQLAGEILEEDMKTTFNMGIGYCLVVPDETVDDTMSLIDMKSWVIGEVT